MPRSAPELRALLENLLQLSAETGWVEFKENLADSETIGEYVSALANAACLAERPFGYLVWGVANGTHEVVGTSFTPFQKGKGNEDLEPWLTRLLHPQVPLAFYSLDYEGNQIVIMEVGRAWISPIRFKNSEFVRVGSTKRALRDYPELERKLWQKCNTGRFEDGHALTNVSVQEALQLLDYPSYFKLSKRPLPANAKGVVAGLCADRLLQETGDGRVHITNCGALLFAHDLSAFSGKQRNPIRLIIYRSPDRLSALREYEFSEGYAISYEKVVTQISDVIPASEEINRALRVKVSVYPEIAIREIVANAVIHQDLTATGTGPMVEVFPDRLEVSNPGTPLVDVLRMIDEPPQSRNEHLASLMRRMGVAEERGTGIDKTVAACELHQLPPPLFEQLTHHTRATLFAPKSYAAMDREERIRACYQHAVLRVLTGGWLTNESLRERLKVPQRNYSAVSRVIADTVERGWIRPLNNSKRHAKYAPFWS